MNVLDSIAIVALAQTTSCLLAGQENIVSPGLECDLRNIDVETVSDIAEEAEYMLVSHNFAPERANQTYFKISVILLLSVSECFVDNNIRNCPKNLEKCFNGTRRN